MYTCMYTVPLYMYIEGREGGERREINEGFQYTTYLYMKMYVSYGYTYLMYPLHTQTHTLHYKHYPHV